MQLRDLLIEPSTDFSIIHLECAQYLSEAGSHFVTRMLPREYADVHRVKIRQHKRQDPVSHVFNEAFHQVHKLRQRSMITTPCLESGTSTHEPFYVFPINGYEYMYSRGVKNSSVEYKQVIDVLFENFDSEEDAAKIITDIVKHTYVSNNLVEGIEAQAEIIFYNIPYYYAIRSSQYPSYNDLIQQL